MQIYNTSERFGIVAVLIHWLMAIVIVGLFCLGKYMHDLDYYDPNYHELPWWHKSIGLGIGLMLIIRLTWRQLNPKVQTLKSVKPIERKLAFFMQILLYVLLFICCISGVMISTAEGASVSFFDWFEVPAFFSYGEQQTEYAGEVHEYSTLALIVLASLHMLAALKHHFIGKNDTLRRMLIIKKENKL